MNKASVSRNASRFFKLATRTILPVPYISWVILLGESAPPSHLCVKVDNKPADRVHYVTRRASATKKRWYKECYQSVLGTLHIIYLEVRSFAKRAVQLLKRPIGFFSGVELNEAAMPVDCDLCQPIERINLIEI
jgi:hypothetical protein